MRLKLLLCLIAATPAAAQTQYDILIRGGTVVDGTGSPGYRADVAIRGDRIARVSRDPIDAARARVVLDARGMVVAPGFIDTPWTSGWAEREQEVIELMALDRVGTPEDVAEVVAALVAASYVTGEIVVVDGGRMALNYTMPA